MALPAARDEPGGRRHMIAVRCRADALFSASPNSQLYFNDIGVRIFVLTGAPSSTPLRIKLRTSEGLLPPRASSNLLSQWGKSRPLLRLRSRVRPQHDLFPRQRQR